MTALGIVGHPIDTVFDTEPTMKIAASSFKLRANAIDGILKLRDAIIA